MANPNVQISILVVDDDPTCLAIVAGYLKRLNHHVVAMKNPVDALCTLRRKYEPFDLILTDVHMPEMSGLELLKHAEEEFGVPVVLMSADNDQFIMLKGLQDGAAFYFVKPISPANLERLWQFAISGMNSRASPTFDMMSTITGQSPDDDDATWRIENGILSNDNDNNNNNNNNNDDVIDVASFLNDDEDMKDDITFSEVQNMLKTPNVDHEDTEVKDITDNGHKKPKLIWTTSLHNQFLEAVNKIGLDKAVPKKILEYMNVPGLKRENVASHLQKYRIFLKRISEASSSMKHGVPNNWNERPFRSSFVLNEITYLTNNLQQQYQQLLSESKGKAKGTTKDANRPTSKKGQSSTQENLSGNNPNKKPKTSGPSDINLYPGEGTQAKHVQAEMTKEKPSSQGLGQQEQVPSGFSIGGTSSNALPCSSQVAGIGNNLLGTTNNYVGLRITTNGELFGTLKDMPVGHQDSDVYNLANGVNDILNQGTIAHEEVTEKSPIYSPWDAPADSLFAMDNDVNIYIPSPPIDNHVAGQQQTCFGAPQETLNANLTDELREIGINFNVNQDVFGSDFFGSYDMQSDVAASLGLDQGIFGNDDFSLDNFFDYGQETVTDFEQDDRVDFTKLN